MSVFVSFIRFVWFRTRTIRTISPNESNSQRYTKRMNQNTNTKKKIQKKRIESPAPTMINELVSSGSDAR